MMIAHLQDLANRVGDEVAVIDESHPIGYAELWHRVNRLAAHLHRDGLAPGLTVGVSINHEYRHLLTALALMRLGCIQVTLPTYESAQYRQSLASQARVQAQVIGSNEHALGAGTPVIAPDFDVDGAECALPAMDDNATCIYFVSSGTTGQPKVIPLSQKQLYHQGANWQHPPGREVFWRPTPIEYNNSKRQRLYNLVNRSTNVFLDPTGRDMLEIVERQGVTRLNLSVVQARHLLHSLNSTARSLPDSCQVRIGGSAVSPDLRAALVQGLTRNLHITYATAEFGSIATAGPTHHADLACTGAIHPGVDLRIVDDAGSPVPRGQLGHIEVLGPGMATAYLNDETASAKAFRDGRFRPGDMGHLSEEGLLFISGRADDMMNLSSINIFPSEIEASFSHFPGLIECAAFGLKSKCFGDIPILAVVGSEDIDLDALLRFGRDRLGLRAPRKAFRVTALPRNPGGKILKDELRQSFERQIRL